MRAAPLLLFVVACGRIGFAGGHADDGASDDVSAGDDQPAPGSDAAPGVLAIDVTSEVAVVPGSRSIDRSTGRYAQSVTVTNETGADIAGPLSLVFDNVGTNAALYHPTGMTVLVGVAGSLYVDLNTALGAGANLTYSVQWENPSGASFTFTTRVLAGPGSR